MKKRRLMYLLDEWAPPMVFNILLQVWAAFEAACNASRHGLCRVRSGT